MSAFLFGKDRHKPFNEELFKKVQGILSKHLAIEESKITPDSSIIDGLGADSLDTVELVLELEEAFSIEIQDEDTETMHTVRDVVDYIETHKRENIS